jgi:Ser/Thr protein kinase RdoA (MazF antagonist)
MAVSTKTDLSAQLPALRQLALRALACYDLAVTHLRLLAMDNNTVFRVDTADHLKYALRISLPGWRDLVQLRSELVWLEALDRDSDLEIPRAVRSPNGDRLITVKVPGLPQARHCVLFQWVEGRKISLRERKCVSTVFKLGETIARLHHQADSFQPPPDFTDKRLDSAWPFGYPTRLYSAEYDELLTPARRSLFGEAAQIVEVALQKLYADPAGLRFLHADLHFGNVKHYQGGLSLLDFDDSIWGYPLQDLGIALYHLGPEAELGQALQAGYSSVRAWPEQYQGQLAILVIARRLQLLNIRLSSKLPQFGELDAEWLSLAEQQLSDWLRHYSPT